MLAKLIIVACSVAIVYGHHGPNRPQGRPISRDIAQARSFEDLLAIALNEETRYDAQIQAVQDNFPNGLTAYMQSIQRLADNLKTRMNANDASCQTVSEIDNAVANSCQELEALGQRDLVTELKQNPVLKRVYDQFARNVNEIQYSINICASRGCTYNEYFRRLMQLQECMESTRRQLRPALLRAFSITRAEAAGISSRGKREIRRIESEWQACLRNLANQPDTTTVATGTVTNDVTVTEEPTEIGTTATNAPITDADTVTVSVTEPTVVTDAVTEDEATAAVTEEEATEAVTEATTDNTDG